MAVPRSETVRGVLEGYLKEVLYDLRPEDISVREDFLSGNDISIRLQGPWGLMGYTIRREEIRDNRHRLGDLLEKVRDDIRGWILSHTQACTYCRWYRVVYAALASDFEAMVSDDFLARKGNRVCDAPIEPWVKVFDELPESVGTHCPHRQLRRER